MILIYVKTLIMLMISHNNYHQGLDTDIWHETDNINIWFSVLEQAWGLLMWSMEGYLVAAGTVLVTPAIDKQVHMVWHPPTAATFLSIISHLGESHTGSFQTLILNPALSVTSAWGLTPLWMVCGPQQLLSVQEYSSFQGDSGGHLYKLFGSLL